MNVQPGGRGPGRPPKAQAPDTRAALVESGIELFARHGYGGTSVRAIARGAGFSESVLYRHFANKQAIFEEVLHQAGAGMFLDLRDRLDPALAMGDPAGFLRSFVGVVAAAWSEPRYRSLVSVLVRAIGESHGQVIAAFDAARAEMAGLFEHWIRSGLIPADRGSEDQLTWELFAPSGFIRLMYMHADASPGTVQRGQQLLRNHAEFFITGVLALPATDKGSAGNPDTSTDPSQEVPRE